MKKYNFFKYGWRLISLLSLLSACQTDQSTKSAKEEIVLTDDLGRKVTLSAPPHRVMALASSLTEMLFFICDTSEIVGVTQTCNFPAAVKQKPVVNTYPMDFEGLLLRKPDLVFTKDGMTSFADAERIQKMGIPVYYQQYQTVEEVFTGLVDIGKIMGHNDRAKAKVDSLRQRIRLIEKQTQHLPKPRVLCITWSDPIIVYGKNTILTDKLRLAGARNAVDSVFAAPYPALSREYFLRLDPDILLGGNFEKMDTTFFKLYPELKRTAAYRNHRIYSVTDDLNSRPSPRVVEAVEELKNLIHPADSTRTNHP